MVKYLNKEGLEKVFEIVKGNQDTLENDITQVLNGMSSTIDGKADSSDVYSKSEIDDLIGNINANSGDAIPRYVYLKADTEGEENTPTTSIERHIESTNIKDADGNLLSNITDVIGALDSGDVIIFEGNDYYGSSYSWVQTVIGDDATVSYAVLYHQGETVYVTDGNAIYRLVVSQPYLHTYHTYLTAVNYALTNDEKAKLMNLPSDVYSKTEVNDLIDGIDTGGSDGISSIEPSTSDEMLYATVDEETKTATLEQNILKENNDKEYCFGYDDEGIVSGLLGNNIVFDTYGEVVNSPLADEGEEIELRKFAIDVAKTLENVTNTSLSSFTFTFNVYSTSDQVQLCACKSGDDLKMAICKKYSTELYDGQVKNAIFAKNGVISDSNYVLISADDEAEIYLPSSLREQIYSSPKVYITPPSDIALTHYIKYQGDKKGYILTDRNCKRTMFDNFDVTVGEGLDIYKYNSYGYIKLNQNVLGTSPMKNGIGYNGVHALNLQTSSLLYQRASYYTIVEEYGRGTWDVYIIDPADPQWYSTNGDVVDTTFSNGCKLVRNSSSSGNNYTVILKILDSSGNPLTWGEDVYFKTWDDWNNVYEVTFNTSDYDSEKVFTRWIKLYVNSYITFEPVNQFESGIRIKQPLASKPTHYLNLIDGTQANLLTTNNFVEATTSLGLITYIKKSDDSYLDGDIKYNYGGSWDYGSIDIPRLKSDNASSVSSGIISRDDWNKLQALPDEAYSKSEVDALIDGIDVSGASGGGNIVKLTQAEYDALEEKDENTIYIITDAPVVTVPDGSDVDLSDYYTKSEVDGLIDGIDVSGGGNVDLAGYATEEWVGDNYYNKTYVDGIVSNVGTQINSKLPIDSFNTWSEGVAMSANVYSKTEIDNKLGDINTILENILS